MEFKDAATQLFERSNAMQGFWGFYITIAAALLGFFGTARRPLEVILILSLVFILIAKVNLDGIRDVAKQRVMLRGLLESAGKSDAQSPLLKSTPPAEVIDGYLRTVHPPSVRSVVTTHLVFDGVVLGAIWFLQYPRA